MIDLKTKYGEWALITGASSGIGKEFALRFAGKGMNVILIARRGKLLRALSKEIKSNFKVKTLVIPIDLAKNDFMKKLLPKVGKKEIGILINNAGFGSIGEYTEIDMKHETAMVKLNCVVPTILTHHFSKQMIKRKKGAVIFLGSVAGFYPVPYMTTYAATKVFNIYLGNALWYELKKHNVDVLTLNPGGTATEFQRIAKTTTGPFVRSAEDVVNTALKALGRRHSIIDGIPNRIMVVLSKFVPNKLLIRIAGNVSVKMYRQH